MMQATNTGQRHHVAIYQPRLKFATFGGVLVKGEVTAVRVVEAISQTTLVSC